MFSPYGQPGSKSDPLSGVVAGRGWTSFRVASKASRTALRMTQYATWHRTAVVFPNSVRDLPLFWIISRHGGWERAGLGSGSGFGSGDAAFDEQVLLAGPAAQQARAAGLITAEVKAAVLDVLAVDRSVAIKVVGELSMLMCWVEAEDARDGRFPPLVDRLARLVGSLEAAAGVPRAAAVPVSAVAGPAAAGCSVIGGAVAMGTSIYTVEGNCSDGSSHVWAYNATAAAPPTVLNLPTPCTNPGSLQTGADLLAVCNEGQDSAALLLLTPGASAFTPVQVQHPDAVGIATDASGSTSGQATLTGLAVSGSTLYVPEWANGMVSVAAITAVNLTNGSTLWTTPFPAFDMEPSLLGATSAGALVEYAKDDGTPAVATLTASSGALTAEHAFHGGSGHADTEALVGDYLIGVDGKPGSGGDQLAGVKID